jgi:hypothetical protein
MSEISWYEIVRQIPEFIKSDIENENLDITDSDSWHDYVHEWADGSEYVIYYHNSRRLWADNSEIQAYEDDALQMAGPTIDDLITACVYLALCDEIMSAIQEIAGETDE